MRRPTMRCFWPPLTAIPLLPSSVSLPLGMRAMSGLRLQSSTTRWYQASSKTAVPMIFF
jgi:hypothetical protein